MEEVSSKDFPPVLRAYKNAAHQHAHSGRTIVVCLDGTGDEFDNDNSNVVKFFAALKKDDPTQLTYYQTGVGTYADSYRGQIQSGLSAALDMAVGASLGDHVREAYSFLMQNYREGDKICIVGFSRGAYTARALAGMLHKVGLLPAHNQAQITFAYKWYKDDSAYGWKMSADFKRTFSIDVNVYFLGCWDTVASVGFIPRILPFAKTNNDAVCYFRHALALDERRAKFKVNHWFQRAKPLKSKSAGAMALDGCKQMLSANGVPEDEVLDHRAPSRADKDEDFFDRVHTQRGLDALARRMSTKEQHTAMPRPSSQYAALGDVNLNALNLEEKGEDDEGQKVKQVDDSPPKRRLSLAPVLRRGSGEDKSGPATIGRRKSLFAGDGQTKENEQALLMSQFNERDRLEFGQEARLQATDVLEVWFCGAHADVGGGAVPNETRHMLSRIPLRWMLRQAFACNTGMLFHSDVLAEHGLDVQTLWPVLQPRRPPHCEPPPSALDRFASGKQPPLEARRNSLRRNSSRLAASAEGKGAAALRNAFLPPSETRLFTEEPLAEDDLSGSTVSTLPTSTSKNFWDDPNILPEFYEDHFDCQADINDQLQQSRPWWILEAWPVKYRKKSAGGQWIKKVGPNLGRHRTVREKYPKMHWTVAERMRTLGYDIRCEKDDEAVWEIEV